MTVQEQIAEQARLGRITALCELFGKEEATLTRDVEEAQSELQRELGVRERCYGRWIEEGKVSRIDAKDRYNRLKKALEIINFMLDTTGKAPSITDDIVPF